LFIRCPKGYLIRANRGLITPWYPKSCPKRTYFWDGGSTQEGLGLARITDGIIILYYNWNIIEWN
jgi:hypothetical protein